MGATGKQGGWESLVPSQCRLQAVWAISVLRHLGRGLGLPWSPGDIGWPPSAVRFYTPRRSLCSLPFPVLPIC